MSSIATSRPKRKAAEKVSQIVEISDSDSDSEPPAPKRTRARTTNRTVDNASKRLTENVERKKQQRRPDKEKAGGAKQAPLTNQSIENVSPKPANEQPDDAPAASNTSLAPATGRSSFWGRRKVWNIHELLAETQNIEPSAAHNIVTLFENENTIPFICRYRRDLVNHITPDRLRDIKNTYTEIVGLRKKAEQIVTQLEKENVINEEIRDEMLGAKSTEELEFLYAPYKPASKGSLAERAKALGLEEYANCLLFGEAPEVVLRSIVDRKNPDLDSADKVLAGICNIVSHNISKHTDVLEELRRLRKVHRITLKSSKVKKTTSTASKADKSSKPTGNSHHGNRNDASKFENYFEYENDIRNLKSHQVLAINRGEKLKFLTVKVEISQYLKNDLKRFIHERFFDVGMKYELRQHVFEKTFDDCYAKKLQPLMSRQIRADLNETARKASIDVFAKNLKQLLLMSPLKGERILGIDPGFTNGCKLAVISETADVLETGVIYPHTRNTDPRKCGEALAQMLAKHGCKIIALGNGTACRETEFWLSRLFEIGLLDASRISYSIVSEQGASIYSCSDVARKEFPTMDMNEISAVSIARRLNDPLSEYVKIEPRHIGVGMYQHDANEKLLTESLNEVVSECVSYVGVDINTASLSVLKHVAGLTEKKAEKIIQYRSECGIFRMRKDLLKVKSIGEKTFIQCAGFIRIDALSVGGKIDNLLDCTWVHPESYNIAEKIISLCKLALSDIGTDRFIRKVKQFANEQDIAKIAETFKVPKERVEIVCVALQRELFQDYRSEFNKRPLFKHGVTRLTELSECDVVTGAVTNVTPFGAFVDIGVECDGLIHISNMNKAVLNIGDRVTASIVQVDVKRKRIGLRLEDMIDETDTSFALKSD